MVFVAMWLAVGAALLIFKARIPASSRTRAAPDHVPAAPVPPVEPFDHRTSSPLHHVAVYTVLQYILPIMNDKPLSETTFLVLTALAERPQHGYGVVGDVQRISDGRVRLRAGTLYAVLDRLRVDGLIEVDREEVVQSRLRRYYRLTTAGARHLSAEVTRLRQNAAAASARLRRSSLLSDGGIA
jgi:DNA-binding PadR family transcriptional regulator